MSVITLDEKERQRFVAYLEQEAVTNKGMAEQIEKLGAVHEVMVKRLRIKSGACIVIADDLKRAEDMTL